MALALENPAYGSDARVAHGTEGDDITGAGGDDHFASAGVDGDVAEFDYPAASHAPGKDEIAWPKVLDADWHADEDRLSRGGRR